MPQINKHLKHVIAFPLTDCFVDVINNASQLVVFVRVNLVSGTKIKLISIVFGTFSLSQALTHLVSKDHALLNERFGQQHRVLLMDNRIRRSMYEKIIFRQEVFC